MGCGKPTPKGEKPTSRFLRRAGPGVWLAVETWLYGTS